MSRLRAYFPSANPHAEGTVVELDGKPLLLSALEITAQVGQMNEGSVNAHATFFPEMIEVDLDARCLRLNAAQLPEEVGRALLAQLKALYGE
jgi:hypothetical protein